MITKAITMFLGQLHTISLFLRKICEKKSRFQTGAATIYTKRGRAHEYYKKKAEANYLGRA